MRKRTWADWAKRAGAVGGVVAYAIIGLEVMIMISPFAFFFYSVFNPVFHWLDQFAWGRPLTDFFLLHMVLPPNAALAAIRVAGSVLFLVGAAGFMVCALQVYLGKLFHWGIANKGLYAVVRHPQYLMLGLWGVGLALLWPRMFVLGTLSLMFVLYYLLAKDEERRMRGQFGVSYGAYMARTGMFLPRPVERALGFLRGVRRPALRYALACVLMVVAVFGSGLGLRAFTVRSLPLTTSANLTALPILPEDAPLNRAVLASLNADQAAGEVSFLDPASDYLAYVMPVDYIMQGMIADTGDNSHLFKTHHTTAMIGDWILHPFEHLRRPPATMMAQMHGADPAMARRHHCPLAVNDPAMDCAHCAYRRVILVRIGHDSPGHLAGGELLAFNTTRTPVGYADINTKTGQTVSAQAVKATTAWEHVPTPPF